MNMYHNLGNVQYFLVCVMLYRSAAITHLLLYITHFSVEHI